MELVVLVALLGVAMAAVTVGAKRVEWTEDEMGWVATAVTTGAVVRAEGVVVADLAPAEVAETALARVAAGRAATARVAARVRVGMEMVVAAARARVVMLGRSCRAGSASRCLRHNWVAPSQEE